MAYQIEDGKRCVIYNVHTMTVITLDGGKTADNTSIFASDMTFDRPEIHMVWQFSQVGDYRKVLNVTSGTAMTMLNGSSSPNTPVVGSADYNNARHQWMFQVYTSANRAPYLTAINVESNTALDLNSGSNKNGTPIDGYEPGAINPNQQWVLVNVS